MSPSVLVESDVEKASLTWFEGLGYEILNGPTIAPGELLAERVGYGEVVLKDRLRSALARINPQFTEATLEDAIAKIGRVEHPSLVENNRQFHHYLVEGVPVEYQGDGRTIHDQVRLIDFSDPGNNDWLAVNQFTVIEDRHNRRPDVVVFINGLPLAIVELKNLADENATIRNAFNQVQTYKAEIPSVFVHNEVIVISDGVGARAGTLTADWERFMPWRTVDGKDVAPKGVPELEVLLKGIFDRRRLLDLIQHFIVFESGRRGIHKLMAAYHQFHAVQKAVNSTVRAVKSDKRVGIVWHTQGSGKSLTMAFYAGKVVAHPEMANPTLVVLTDRNDLDDQLFGVFHSCQELLRQTPVQAESRAQLRKLLSVAAGGVVFTTIQKFLPEQKGDEFPLLSDRRNIIVIADEAHRSQYDFIGGFAKHMRDALPNASFIGFTATPIELADRSTPAVFGEYIDVYDIQRAIEDGVTVRIYYEARLAKLALNEAEKPKIDPDFEEVTEGEEEAAKKKLKSKWARLEALVGADKRIGLVAKDIIEHFDVRLEAIEGKALIVCMSRRICVALYAAIRKLRPSWHDSHDEKGFMKVVMTGSATDPVDWQEHIRDKTRRQKLGDRFKDANDPLKLVLVRDMWLTGFDVPSLHTMYLDKPMKGHGLMQAIARVNRVFKDKPGGLAVDYLGIAHELRKALADYTERDRSEAGVPQEVAVDLLLRRCEVVEAMFHRFDYSSFFKGVPQDRVRIVPAAMEHILTVDDGKNRFLKGVSEVSKAFALAVPHEKALVVREQVGFFQAVRAAFVKNTEQEGKDPADLDLAVSQLVSRAVAPDKVVDIFGAAGLKKPDLSILSDGFLAEIRQMPYKNVALEVLRKLLNDEIKVRSRKNLVQAQTFTHMLEEAIRKYHNRSIEAAQIIEELIKLAREMRAANQRGEKLGLTEEEIAFYDALETNDSAVRVLGDETLRTIARELVKAVRLNTTIDWTVKESVRAKLRVLVRRILRKYGYPPDKQEKATLTVLGQAELFSREWAA